MSVEVNQVKVGTVFKFKTANRRVIAIAGRFGTLTWEYADGIKRGGRINGKQHLYYFAANAIEQIFESSEDAFAAVLNKIPEQPQRQDSTNDQLRDLRNVANRLGMYDAADLIRTMLEQK